MHEVSAFDGFDPDPFEGEFIDLSCLKVKTKIVLFSFKAWNEGYEHWYVNLKIRIVDKLPVFAQKK